MPGIYATSLLARAIMCFLVVQPFECQSYVLELHTKAGAKHDEVLTFPYDQPERLLLKLRSLDPSYKVHSVKVVLDAVARMHSLLVCMLPLWTKRGDAMLVEIFPAKRFTREIDERIHDEAKKRSTRMRHWDWPWLFGVGLCMNRVSDAR